MGGFVVLGARLSRCRLLVVLAVVMAVVSSLGAVSSAKAAVAQASPSSAQAPFPFDAALRSYLSTRSGRVSVAMFDARTGETYSYNRGARFVTASVAKVSILGTLLRQAQDARRSLTSTERSLARRMIVHSDNAATTTLWNKVGRASGVRAFMKKVGMPSTTPGPDSWGLTLTNTPDQVRLVRMIAYPNAVLSDASRTYARSLMRGVTPSQKWGVSSGVPTSATVGLKNGWLPRTGGWVINSVGYVRGGPRNYVIAVLTSGNPSMSYGINTIQHVSKMVAVVRPAVSLSGPSSGETRRAFRMAGYGYPARRGRVVVVQRFASGSWRDVGRAKQSSTGRYSVVTSVPSGYKFRYRAVALAWRGDRAVVSPSRVVAVHAP